MTYSDHEVDDVFFKRLRSVFGEAEVVELTAGIAMENEIFLC